MSLPPVAAGARARARTAFLVWHDVIASSRERLVWFDTTLAEFRAQCERIERAGARPIPLPEAARWLTQGQAAPPPGAVVLFFDDNTDGIFDHAFPELQRRGWPFAVSAHTAYVGVRTSKGHNDWGRLATMAAGGATIVSQTMTHPPDLRDLSDAALRQELTGARTAMTHHLATPPKFLTYPSGKWNERVASAAEAAGYALAFTEDYGLAERSPHRLGINRFSTHRRFAEALAAIKHSAGGG